MGLHRRAIGLWRKRWREAFERLARCEVSERPRLLAQAIEDLLADAPGRGGTLWQRTKDSPVVRNAVMATGIHYHHRAIVINRTTWKVGNLKMWQSGYRISLHCIRSIIREEGYRWRKGKAKRVLTSNDPDYRAKVIGSYPSYRPLVRTAFFSADEYGPFSITPSEEYTHQKPKGCLIVTAALELCTNQVTHFFSEKKDTEEMIRLLDLLLTEYAGMELYFCRWTLRRAQRDSKESGPRQPAERNEFPSKSRVGSIAIGSPVLERHRVCLWDSRAIIQNSDYQSEQEAMQAP